MKKTLSILLAVLAITTMLMLVTYAYADTLTDGSGGALTVDDWSENPQGLWTLTMIYTDTDGNGTTGIDIPTTFTNEILLNKFRKAVVTAMSTNPDDTTAPTDLYDIVVNKKTLGVDCFQGGAANRSTSSSETAFPLRGYEHPDQTLQLVVTNQSVSGAIVQITLYVEN